VTDRLWFLATIIAALYIVFIGRLFHLQIVQGSHYAQLVEQSRLVTEVLAPERGRIVDRNGTPIADTRPVYNLGVTFSELELRGRARRELPFYRLDEKRFAAFIADLAGRVRVGNDPMGLRNAVVRELLNHPAVAVRSGSNGLEVTLGLVALPRASLQPQFDPAKDGGGTGLSDLALLAEGDLLSDDPREALEREIALAWSKDVTIIGEDEFQATCERFDQEMEADEGSETDGGGQERSLTILEPFTPAFALRVPDGFDAAGNLTAVDLALRIMVPERRAQAEATLARVLGESQPLIHERLERALQASRVPRHSKELYYGARSQAERIAPMLPEGQVLSEIPVLDVPGARERVLIIQGDAVDGDGPCTQICRRIADNLGTDPDLVEALLMKHAERIRAITCERDYRVHHMAIDPARLERLTSGLAEALTGMGRPTTTLDIESALAKVRRSVDREWTGNTRFDALSLIPDISHSLAVRLQNGNSEAPRDLLADFQDADAELPGLVVQVDVGRSYPFPASCCHFLGTIGHTDVETDGDDRTGLLPGSLNGISGLEQIYDAQLRGVAGEKVMVRTPDGVRTLRDDPAKPGSDVVTQLDMELQTMAEDSLDHYYELAQALGSASDVMDKARAIGRGRAGFCMIDCRTGGILALASSPRYKIEDLRTRYADLAADPAEPLMDHASVPEMPPGSCFKILTALCCLEHEVIEPTEEIYCQGFMTMSHGKKVLRDHAPAGTYDLPHAIQVSSNVYFATIGARLKPEWLSDLARAIGLGRRNAADVQEQRSGILPTPHMLLHMPDRVRNHETKWMTSDSWRMAIGQFATASPLQCVAIAAAVANGGHIVQPFLVRPTDAQGLPDEGPPVVKDLDIRKEYLDQVRLGMEMVTDNEPHATGKLLVLEGAADGIKVAAKTGTSEAGGNEELHPDNAWMIGYAPADNPTVAFACFIHSGTFGGSACTPVVKRVLEAYFAKYGRGGHAQPQAPAPEQAADGTPAAAPAPATAPATAPDASDQAAVPVPADAPTPVPVPAAMPAGDQ